MNDYHEIINRIDMRELLAQGKRIIGNRPVMLPCLWHNEKRDSMAVYQDHIHCFGCNRHISILEYIAEKEGLDISNSFPDVVNIASSKYANIPNTQTTKPKITKDETKHFRHTLVGEKVLQPMDNEIAKYAHNNLGSKRQWYKDRGLLDRIINAELLGYLNNAYSIPIWNNRHELIAMRYRRDDSINTKGNKYWGTKGRNETLLYNHPALEPHVMIANNHTIILCEGELDTLILWQYGTPAITITNGVGNYENYLRSNITLFNLVWKVIIATDMDDIGTGMAKILIKIFGSRAKRLKWDKSLGKDITELNKNIGIDKIKKMLKKL